MITRLVWVAFAWLAALGLFAAALHWSGSARPPRPAATSWLARSINDAQRTTNTTWRWSATHTTSAQRAMVVTVEAFNVEDARGIAETIVEPRRAQFDEILVYVKRVGRGTELAPRRVEWTPRDGYVETRYPAD